MPFENEKKSKTHGGIFQNLTFAILDIFRSCYLRKRNGGRHVVTFFMSTKFVKNIVSKLRLVWIMAEIEPYSFEPSICLRFMHRKTTFARVSWLPKRKYNVLFMWVLCELGRAIRSRERMLMLQGDHCFTISKIEETV